MGSNPKLCHLLSVVGSLQDCVVPAYTGSCDQECFGDDAVSCMKLGCKNTSWLPPCSSSWITCSGESQLPYCDDTRATCGEVHMARNWVLPLTTMTDLPVMHVSYCGGGSFSPSGLQMTATSADILVVTS